MAFRAQYLLAEAGSEQVIQASIVVGEIEKNCCTERGLVMVFVPKQELMSTPYAAVARMSTGYTRLSSYTDFIANEAKAVNKKYMMLEHKYRNRSEFYYKYFWQSLYHGREGRG